MAKHIISEGESFEVEQVSREFGATRLTAFAVDGSTGDASFGGDVAVAGTMTVAGDLNVTGDMALAGLVLSNLDLGTATELTISGGAVTKTQSYHTIDTQGDAASDDLDTISGGADGELLLVRPASAARTVVLKHNTGNLFNPAGEDVSLAEATDTALYAFHSSKWNLIGVNLLAFNGGGLGATLSSTANGKGASKVGIEDAATLYTATDVEAALAEVKALADAAIALGKRTVRIQHTDLTDAVNGEAEVENIGAVLPANAVVLAHEVQVDTLFSGGGATAVKLDIGGTDPDAIVSQQDVFTGATTGATSARTGVHAQGKFSAQQLVATFTPDGGHTLNDLTAGDLTITVWYSVLA